MPDINTVTESSAQIIIDLDQYGRTDSNGDILALEQNRALSNAMIIFLRSKPGDYMLTPNKGGLLTRYEFKMQNVSEVAISAEIDTALKEEFGLYISAVASQVTFVREKNTMEIAIVFQSIFSASPFLAEFSTRSAFNSESAATVVESYPIPFDGENLYNFIFSEVEKYEGHRLRKSPDGLYSWAVYSFPALSENDPYLDQIKNLLG